MSPQIFSVGVLLSLLAASGLTGFAQTKPQPSPEPEDEVVSVTTSLVTVPVTVKDRKGKTVFDLRERHFHLYEDGIEQEITYFDGPEPPNQASANTSHGTNRPLTLALLLDISDSTELELQAIKDSAIAFVDKLSPDDRVVVMAFDQDVRVIAGPDDNRETMRSAIQKLRTGRGTSVYYAVDSITTWLGRISGRKAIVLLTDGVDTASKKGSYLGTVAAAEHLDATVYPIQFNTYADFADNPTRQTDTFGGGGTAHMTRTGELASEAYKRATLYLRELAEKTGGRFEYSDSVKSLARSFERVAEQVRDQYTLGYYPKDRAKVGRRQLAVRVEVPGVSAKTRKSYVLKPSSR
jgi:VWFA-related protein